MSSSHFNPERAYNLFGAEVNNKQKYEGLKAAFSADLLASEKCFEKCPIRLDTRQFNDEESACLRQCYVKYFDCALLVESEMHNYVSGLPL